LLLQNPTLTLALLHVATVAVAFEQNGTVTLHADGGGVGGTTDAGPSGHTMTSPAVVKP
jgi:hypothetical protein